MNGYNAKKLKCKYTKIDKITKKNQYRKKYKLKKRFLKNKNGGVIHYSRRVNNK